MKLSREIKAGIIVLGGILLFIMGFSYLKSSPIFESSRQFYAIYDNVENLEVGTPVVINGFKVGKVSNITFIEGTYGKLLVTLRIREDIKFSKNSVVELYDNGIIGGKGIQIVVDNQGTVAKHKDTLKSSRKIGISDLLQQKLPSLLSKVDKVVTHVDSLLIGIHHVFDRSFQEKIKNNLSRIDTIISNFQSSFQSLNSILLANESGLQKSLMNFNKITGNFAVVSDSVAKAGLGKTVVELRKTVVNLNTLLSDIKSRDGSLGKLIYDEKMYQNLSEASKQLELLLEDFRINPKRYVHFSIFGKKQKPYNSKKTQKQKE